MEPQHAADKLLRLQYELRQLHEDRQKLQSELDRLRVDLRISQDAMRALVEERDKLANALADKVVNKVIIPGKE